MKVKRTPRELVKEVEGARFVFDRPDYREIGLFFASRPEALSDLQSELVELKKNGEEMPDEEYRERSVAINRANPQWYRTRVNFVLSKLRRVENLEYEDGTPVPQEALEYDLPGNVLGELLSWYESAMIETMPGVVPEEKKTDSATLSEATPLNSIPA